MTKKYTYYALTIIFLANFFNYLDRILVSAVLPRIQSDFDIGSAKAGFLWTAFTLGYMITAPFIGYLSDRKSRTKILAICIFIWSVATIFTGIVNNYYLLIFIRVLTGIGEAGSLIIGPVLISDYFSKDVRGKALGIFYLGLPIGGVAGYLIGGNVTELIGWRYAFYIAGIPGIFIAYLIWFLYEPQRGSSELSESGHTHTHALPHNITSYKNILKTKTFLFIVIAQATAVFTIIPLLHFGTTYFESVRGMGIRKASIILGSLAAIAGLIGNLLGGYIGDKLYKKIPSVYSLMASLGFFAGFVFMLIGILSTPQYIWIPAFALCFLFYFACMLAVNTQIANIIHPSQRAMAFAIAVFTVHILGDTFSPPIFGYVSDFIGMKKAYAIFSFSLIISSFFCLIAAKFAKQNTYTTSNNLAKN